MDITPAIPFGKKIITRYGSGSFKVNDEVFNGNIVVYPDSVTLLPNVDNEIITNEILATFFEETSDIELVIIGCGVEHQPVKSDITQAFRNKGISVEVMTTGAACRTYNVLLSEGRQVAAILLAV